MMGMTHTPSPAQIAVPANPPVDAAALARSIAALDRIL